MGFLSFVCFVLVVAAVDMVYNPSDNIWLGFVVFVVMESVVQLFSVRKEYITVKSKGVRKVKPFGLKVRFVKASDGRVYANDDDHFMLKFNAKKLQSEIKVGKRYEIKSYKVMFGKGYNILSATEVKSVKRNVKK